MKNHRFLWLRNRTTNNRKCEKARNIKEKRTIEMFNTASKPLVALRSSPSANFPYFSVRLTTSICRKFSAFGAVRGPRKWSVLLRKKQARSTRGTRIASEKSLMKQEIIPQGVHLLLFCAARLLMPIRKRTVLTKSSRASAS